MHIHQLLLELHHNLQETPYSNPEKRCRQATSPPKMLVRWAFSASFWWLLNIFIGKTGKQQFLHRKMMESTWIWMGNHGKHQFCYRKHDNFTTEFCYSEHLGKKHQTAMGFVPFLHWYHWSPRRPWASWAVPVPKSLPAMAAPFKALSSLVAIFKRRM